MAFGDFTVDRNDKKYVLGSGGTIIEYAEDEPAFEFNADGSYKGLLVEPAATNVCIQSEDISTSWGPSNATITTNDTTAPDGTTTADKLEATATGGTGCSVQQPQVTSASTYTFSVWLKEGNTTTSHIRFTDTGVVDAQVALTWATRTVSGNVAGVTARVVTDLGSGDWIRISLTYTLAAGGTDSIRIFAGATGSATAGEYIHVWGAQLEQGPIATSYIPTTTGQVQRVKDNITLGSASSLIGQTEGTLYVEVYFRQTGLDQRMLQVSDGTGANRIIIWAYSTNTYIDISIGNSNVVNQGAPSLADGVQKFALAYANGDQEFYRNGSSIATDAASLAALPTLTDIDLGQSAGSGTQANMWIRAAALFTRRLSDSECIALTTL